MDAEQLREYGHKMVDFIADYYKTIENFPVLSQVEVFINISISYHFFPLSCFLVSERVVWKYTFKCKCMSKPQRSDFCSLKLGSDGCLIYMD